MRIEQLWRELEVESRDGASSAWLTRLALPDPSQRLLAAVETASNRRALLLCVPKGAIPPRREWPVCHGLEVFGVTASGHDRLGVLLSDPTFSDVFAVLAEDVAPRVASAVDAGAAVSALFTRLRRWQKFLAAGAAGLSVERQRGLYGELLTLGDHLIPAVGTMPAVAGWRAPSASHQDFQYEYGAVEVKSATGKQPSSVRIASERQLDDTGILALFLHVVLLDERIVEQGSEPTGDALPRMVEQLRNGLRSQPQALDVFDERLLEAGYLDMDAARYEPRRFALRQERTFRVGQGFPRLLEVNLPIGVGSVSYSLSLAACEAFALDRASVPASFAALAGGSPRPIAR